MSAKAEWEVAFDEGFHVVGKQSGVHIAGDIKREAVANLIAAAPELLDALKALADMGGRISPHLRHHSVMADAYAAIRRAEGK